MVGFQTQRGDHGSSWRTLTNHKSQDSHILAEVKTGDRSRGHIPGTHVGTPTLQDMEIKDSLMPMAC